MKTIRLLFLCAILVAGPGTGCSNRKYPEGMPKLHPCTIRITQDGVPAEGVRISLYGPPLTDRWGVSGDTDSAGVARLQTHGNFHGAPSGDYKIVLSKSVMEGGSGGEEIPAGRKAEPIRVYSLVDPKYNDPETTPLEISVGERAAETKFDIGRQERHLLETMTGNE